MEVHIPSPSVFLKKSPIITPAITVPPKKPSVPKPKSAAPTKPNNKVQVGAVTKPKQSKSRNGCMTCKKKRLKCDETKPSCVQCQKRSVTCEGYKKDYKWRTFEETTFNSKPAIKKKPVRSNSFSDNLHLSEPFSLLDDDRQTERPRILKSPHEINHPQSWSPGLHSAFASATHAFQDHEQPPSQGHRYRTSASPSHGAKSSVRERPSGPEPLHLSEDAMFMPSFDPNNISPGLPNPDNVDPYRLLSSTTNTSSSSVNDNNSMRSFNSASPQLADLLLPGTDLNQPPDPSELRPPMSPLPYQPLNYDLVAGEMDDFDEEITRSEAFPGPFSLPPKTGRSGDFAHPSWNFRSSSPTPSEASTTSSRSSDLTLIAQPTLPASSAEMLMLRFDKQTCGILSIKDGPTENPWRTLIWPLARESQALYHAISSMTAFHGASEVADLQLSGMAHMTQSIKRLAVEIRDMRLDTALATSLALAFSEGWDCHMSSTGVQHLRGAKVMVNNALVKHRRDMQMGLMTTQDATRLKFLCNTFVYMDVIARLTTLEESSDLNFENILGTVNLPMSEPFEVDPLMGCATTLFPLVGRVANLIQRVRKSNSNSLSIVSQAMELKEQLQQWKAPSASHFERPEDPTSEVQHSISTAEAYRTAVLLYLHQAVPEIPSESADSLAHTVLFKLAAVPLSSRTIIVQIFPLFAACCELTGPEDREFATIRWEAMMMRLKIGNVMACWSVVQEVWNRRDEFLNEKEARLLQRYNSRGVPSGNFVPPVLNNPTKHKRRPDMSGVNVGDMENFFNQGQDQTRGGPGFGEDMDPATGRNSKRRPAFEMNNFGRRMAGHSMSTDVPGNTRRGTGDIPNNQLEPEYTVRGRLHWLKVMADFQLEGMIAPLTIASARIVALFPTSRYQRSIRPGFAYGFAALDPGRCTRVTGHSLSLRGVA